MCGWTEHNDRQLARKHRSAALAQPTFHLAAVVRYEAANDQDAAQLTVKIDQVTSKSVRLKEKSKELELVAPAEEKAWPMGWAVAHRGEPGKTPGPQGTVYIFELPGPASEHLLVEKPTGDGVVEFERAGLAEDKQEDWRLTERLPAVSAVPPKRTCSRSPLREGSKMSFADGLSKIVSERRGLHTDHEKLSHLWLAHEVRILDKAEMERIRQETHADYETEKMDLELDLNGVPKALDILRDRRGDGAAATLQVGAEFAAVMRQSAKLEHDFRPQGAEGACVAGPVRGEEGPGLLEYRCE